MAYGLGDEPGRVFNCTKVFIDGMIAQGWGRVVTSVIGQIGNFGQVNYAASKAGVAAFTKSLAKEVAAKGIGQRGGAWVHRDRNGHNDSRKGPHEAPRSDSYAALWQGEEVARACVYLCSSDGDYITGSELMLNGGLYM